MGHCHYLASVQLAVLYPFGPMLGWEVRFREGFHAKNKRDVEAESEDPIAARWDGTPRRAADHTWCEVTLLPSLVALVCDPSSHQITVPLGIA